MKILVHAGESPTSIGENLGLPHSSSGIFDNPNFAATLLNGLIQNSGIRLISLGAGKDQFKVQHGSRVDP